MDNATGRDPVEYHNGNHPLSSDQVSHQPGTDDFNERLAPPSTMEGNGVNNPNNNHHSSLLPEHRHDFLTTLAGVAGNVLEWYDFAVFGFFGDVIGEVFFPPQAGHSQMVESFAVFGVAFLMRPLGGLVMGYIGDVYGRKKALVLSIFLMAFPTFAMGCLPSYQQVGPIAIGLLLTTRMLQGLCVGGQLMSSLVFTLEGHDPSVWGLFGSFVMAAANFGTLLGNLAAFVMRGSLTDAQLASWGWRIPFLSGILVSISGFYLKSAHGEGNATEQSIVLKVPTSEDEISDEDGTGVERDQFHDESDHHQPDNGVQQDHDSTTTSAASGETSRPTNPLKLAFAKDNLRALAAASMVPMLSSAGFYLVFVWMAAYMEELSANPIRASFEVNAFSLLFALCIFYPVAGHLSDRVGRIQTMTVGAVTMCLLSPLLIRIIGGGHAWAAFGAQLVWGICLSFWGAPMCAWLVESFDPHSRLTSVAIGYNLAQALIGGSAPAVATLLVDDVSVTAPGGLLAVIALISLMGLRCVAPPRHDHHQEHCSNRTIASSPRRFAAVDQRDQHVDCTDDDDEVEFTERAPDIV